MASYTNIPVSSGGLTPIANNTVLGNTSGGSATPTAQTAANLIAAGIIQDPANVAITGGNIVGVNTATTTTQGAMSAADKTNVNGQRFLDSWGQDAANTIATAVPSLTRFVQTRLLYPLCTTGTPVDAGVEGGGFTAGATTNLFWGGTTVYQAPSAKQFGVAWRGRLLTPSAAGHDTYLGIARVASPHYGISVIASNGVSSTKYALSLFAASGGTNILSTVNADSNWHTFVITFDLTTVKLFIDGTLQASTTTLTNLIGSPVVPYMYNDTQGDTIASDYLIAYVAP